MEEQIQPLQQESSDLYQQIYNAAKMAGIAAVVSLTGTLAGVVGTFMKPTTAVPVAASEGFDENAAQQLAQGSVLMSGLIALVIGGLAFYFLFRFASLAKNAVGANNRSQLAAALHQLSRYFKLWGLIMVLIIGLFIFSLFGGLLGSAFGA